MQTLATRKIHIQSNLILIDGSSYLFRAYHALPPLSNSKGFPTQAIRGVLSMIKALQKQWKEAQYIVVFDAKGKTFRHELYPEYKANRQAMPEDLALQIEPLQQIIRATGLPLISMEGVEADDVIATLAEQGKAIFEKIYLATSDKDMAQLVDDQIHLLDSKTYAPISSQGVLEKYGVKPEQIIDYLVLVGDSSDNIPGVNKVGPKTAAKWLAEYGDLSNLLAHAGSLKGKVAEYLIAHQDFIPLSQQLVTIKKDLILPFKLEYSALTDRTDHEALLQYYRLYEFKSWAEELAGKVQKTPSETFQTDYQTILTEQALDEYLAKVKKARLFAFDTETTSLNYTRARLVGVSMAIKIKNKKGEEQISAVYIPCDHSYVGVPEQISTEVLLARLKPLLTDPQYQIVGQNIKYDAHVLRHYQIDINAEIADTMLMSYVYNPTAGRHDLDSLADLYLQRGTIKFEDIAGKGSKQISFSQVNIDEATKYAAEDAELTLQLYYALQAKLAALSINNHSRQLEILQTLELPLVPVILAMEAKGVLIDKTLLAEQSQLLAKAIEKIKQQAYDLAGHSFNLDSPKQLQIILYDQLQIKVIKKTPKGQPSTAEPVLAELAHIHPLPQYILNYRSLAKLKSTYTDRLPEQINPQSGRVHTSYHQAVTATGRLSSSDPNLQNIPIRTSEGKRIREAFITPAGYKMLSADYSQIELRIMAHLSEDQSLIQAFLKDQDIHRATASEVFDVTLDQVDSEQRRRAKAINFGLIYGMSAFGLGRQLNIGRKEAQAYIHTYFERYPGVSRYMEKTRQQAAEQGYVETLLGRRLYLPNIHSANANQRMATERAAINAPLQGTAADLIKLAMIKIYQWLADDEIPASMIMQVHDELVFEIKNDCLEQVKQQIVKIMSEVMQLRVPLKVDMGVGNNWQEAH